MEQSYVLYCILQYSPRPERFEYVNVGVVVVDSDRRMVVKRSLADFTGVRRFSNDPSASFIRDALEDFSDRVAHDLSRYGKEVSADRFNSNRAGIFRITPVMPALGSDLAGVADKLFDDLVTIRSQRKKGERVSARLAVELRRSGVLSLLQKNPAPVKIAKWGVELRADYGYQNGAYNLIDSARFDDPERGLAEAGKRILEGRALSETLEHRLIVVGEFGDQPKTVVNDLRDEFSDAGAKLYALDEVGLLAEEIRRTAH